MTFLYRDEEHIQKAFVFAGMPARNGVTAAVLIQSGFTGVSDPFSGEESFFDAFSPIPAPRPEVLAQGLGSLYEIMFTNIKKFSVGSPIQAPLDALLLLIEKYGLTSENVESIVARLPDYGARTVDNRSMPNINLQYILAVTLLDRDLTFKEAHSYDRMKDPAVVEAKERIKLVEDPGLSGAKIMRQGIVEITTRDGARFREHVVSVRGTAENPMTFTGGREKIQGTDDPCSGGGPNAKAYRCDLEFGTGQRHTPITAFHFGINRCSCPD